MKLADIVEAGMPALIAAYGDRLSWHQRQALQAILGCRRGAFGSTHMQCPDCGHTHLRHRSCGHRSCPQCQHQDNVKWLARQQHKLLPVNYFMVTFTLPAQLRSLAAAHERLFYQAMFDVATDTISTFANNHKQLQGDSAACAVLHTHSRRLDYHPHIHLIVPATAFNTRRRQCRKIKGKYLFNGRQLATVFRARLIHRCNQLSLNLPNQVPNRWNAQCQFVGNGLPALKYLSRYLYRGIISEPDIIAHDTDRGTVSFRYRDGKSGKPCIRTLPIADFLLRIAIHVLPKGFRRLRDYGFLHGNARIKLQRIQLLLLVELPAVVEPKPLSFHCPLCQATMINIGFHKPR